MSLNLLRNAVKDISGMENSKVDYDGNLVK